MADYTQDMTTGAFVGKAECRVLKASGWIPVEERLPEDREYLYYMVQDTDGDIIPAYMYRGKWHSCLGVRISVAAWQERPAPYVKPRRFVVYGPTIPDSFEVWRTDVELVKGMPYGSAAVAMNIPTREAAETIAKVYEEAYRGE